MARITVEDCLQKEPNIVWVAHLAIKRARQILKGDGPVVKSTNKPIVTALREIAADKVRFKDIKDDARPKNDSFR